MLKNLYKALWSKIGGRPWTYIVRDIWHQLEYFMQAGWFFIGIAVYIWLGWMGVLLFWLFYTWGYVNGHFFYGTDYTPNQPGE